MNTQTTTTASTSPTRAPVAWGPIHVAALLGSHGCNGSETHGFTLSDQPVTRDVLEQLWASARDAEREAERIYTKAHAKPGIFAHFDAKSPYGTYGEWRAARAAHDAASSTWYRESREAQAVARNAVWAAGGVRVVQIDGPLPYVGLDYDDADDEGVPVVLHDFGCRCGWGGVWYGDDINEQEPAALAYVCQLDVRGVMQEVVSLEPRTDEELQAALASAEVAYQVACDAATDRKAEQLWAESLSDDEVDALDAARYARYRKLAPVRGAVRAHVASEDPGYRFRAALDAAGLYLVEVAS